MIPWEGAADYYRDVMRHGSIVSMHSWNRGIRARLSPISMGIVKALWTRGLGEQRLVRESFQSRIYLQIVVIQWERLWNMPWMINSIVNAPQIGLRL
jgi:hypothetical protein